MQIRQENIAQEQNESEDLDAFIKHLNSQEEVRIFVDVKADGTGHHQASLDVAERLRQFGYEGTITFVLGDNMLDELNEFGDGITLTYSPYWADYSTSFNNLLSKRITLEDNIQIISQDMVEDSLRGATLRQILRGEKNWGELVEEYAKTENIDFAIDVEEMPEIPRHTNFKPIVDLGFSGAADDGSGFLDEVTGTKCCIALQPMGWERGQSGIWAGGKRTPFKDATINKLFCSIYLDKIEENCNKYFEKHPPKEALTHLLEYVNNENPEIVLLYNPYYVNVGNTRQLSENLVKCFKKNEKKVLFIEICPPDNSLWAPKQSSSEMEYEDVVFDQMEFEEKKEEEISPDLMEYEKEEKKEEEEISSDQYKFIKLEDLTKKSSLSSQSHSVVQCQYLPIPICDYLLTKSSLVVCEGQGTAQKALVVGIPCLHGPKNAPKSIYYSVPSPAQAETEGEEFLKTAIFNMANSVLNDTELNQYYEGFHSSKTQEYCTALKDRVGTYSDRFTSAIIETVKANKILGLQSKTTDVTMNFKEKYNQALSNRVLYYDTITPSHSSQEDFNYTLN